MLMPSGTPSASAVRDYVTLLFATACITLLRACSHKSATLCCLLWHSVPAFDELPHFGQQTCLVEYEQGYRFVINVMHQRRSIISNIA